MKTGLILMVIMISGCATTTKERMDRLEFRLDRHSEALFTQSKINAEVVETMRDLRGDLTNLEERYDQAFSTDPAKRGSFVTFRRRPNGTFESTVPVPAK